MRRLREEDGWTVISALLVGVVVLSLGLAVLQTVDVQSRQSGAERARESAFQLAESALNNTSLQLGRVWPASTSTAYPVCTQASTPSSTCIGTGLAPNYTSTVAGAPRGGVDFNAAPTWQVTVIDDLDGPSYYSESLLTRNPAPCACDLAGATGGGPDGFLWVRAESTVAGHTHVLVQLVGQGAPQVEALPNNAITAGWFKTSNRGRKVIVDAKGNSATAGTVSVRCASSGAPTASNPCLGYDEAKGQLTPKGAYKASYTDGSATPNATNRTILTPAALARLKQRAQSLGTYYAAGSCPPSLTGDLVFVENANCSYVTGTANSAASPGVVIFGGGTLTLGGNTVYYGVIYMGNSQGTAPSSGPCTSAYQNTVVTTIGTALVSGAMFIDHCGGYTAGASGLNFVYDSNAANRVVSNGLVQAVKNSFRIISSS
jgi:type II secretory pathway pseudopilin PulG